MKKSFVLGALLLAALPTLACDQCGCGMLLGVQPYDHANNFGLYWRMRYLKGDIHFPGAPLKILKHGGHAEAGAGAGSAHTAEYVEAYAVLEANGQVWIGDRFSITASIPLLNNFQAVDHVRRVDLYAVGDPRFLGRYVVSASKSGPDTAALRHRFTVGLGLKVPWGRTDVEQYGERVDHDMQPSTGAVDGLVSLEYSLRGKRWGTSLNAFGLYSGVMADGYRLGHGLNFSAEVFRAFQLKNVQLLPSAGGYYERLMKDEMHGVPDPATGGNTLFANLGTRLWWHGIGLQLAWQHAVVNDMGGSMIPNRERFTAGITYNIPQN